VAGLNILLALAEKGVKVKLWPIGQIDAHPKHTLVLQEALDTRHCYRIDAPSLRIWHQYDLAQHVGSGVRVGFPIFELDKFNAIEHAELCAMDVLCVCSNWAKGVVLRNCPEIPQFAIIVTPLGVDRTTFHHENAGVSDPKWTTFLNIGKWEYRKGHDILIEAFNKAFEPKDRVRLWMMNHNPFLSKQQTKEWEDLYTKSKMGHRVSILPRVQDHAEVAKVMSEADCGVFPSRAEGWNLELLEMMSMGKQVITTNYSAHTEFCTTDNAHLIPIDELEHAYDGHFFTDDDAGQWATLGSTHVDCLVDHMRNIHKNKQQINHSGIATAKEFSWAATAQKILTVDQIWA